MKVVKPQRLGLLHRTYERGGKYFLAVTSIVFFPFEDPSILLPEAALWKFVAEQLGQGAILDQGIPKQQGEILVKGSAYAPFGRPSTGVDVRVKAGPIDKRLYVFGDRYWRRTNGLMRPTEPKPFVEMPITWSNAFGGVEVAENPLGKGVARVPAPNSETLQPLPNVENPAQLIGQPSDRPRSAGLAPYDLTLPQRYSKMGTYDERWLKERFPYFANDFDWSFFNLAPRDQWLSTPVSGGEAIEITGMHPSKAQVKSTVPSIVVRCFVNQSVAGSLSYRELKTIPETLWLFPHIELGILLYRSIGEIADDDADDVHQLLIAAEASGASRSIDHYRTALQKRLDRTQAYKWLLRDDELLPPTGATLERIADDTQEMAALTTPKMLQLRRRWKKASNELERAKQSVLTERAAFEKKATEVGDTAPDLSGFDKFLNYQLPPLEIPSNPLNIDFDALEKQAKQVQAETLARQEAAIKNARESFKSFGLDYDRVVEQQKQSRRPGPPKFSAEEQIREFRKLHEEVQASGSKSPQLAKLLADPEFEAGIRRTEERLRDMYRQTSHLKERAGPLPPAEAAFLREQVSNLYAKRAGLATYDLSGGDLKGMILRGADLKSALVEGADFSDVDLTGADLSGAVLAFANLKNAKLANANLKECNLGRANLEHADLTNTDLTKAILYEADLSNSDLTNANLAEAQLMGARFEGSNFTKARIGSAQFIGMTLSGARFTDANLEKATFVNCMLLRSDFAGSNLKGALFCSCKVDEVSFASANCENLRVVQESSFNAADFSHAKLMGANLRATGLEGANFENANFSDSDLSEANLSRANLKHAIAKRTRLVRANLVDADFTGADLFEAVFQKSLLVRTKFEKANLYRADLFRAVVGHDTNFQDANLKRTVFSTVRNHEA